MIEPLAKIDEPSVVRLRGEVGLGNHSRETLATPV